MSLATWVLIFCTGSGTTLSCQPYGPMPQQMCTSAIEAYHGIFVDKNGVEWSMGCYQGGTLGR